MLALFSFVESISKCSNVQFIHFMLGLFWDAPYIEIHSSADTLLPRIFTHMLVLPNSQNYPLNVLSFYYTCVPCQRSQCKSGKSQPPNIFVSHSWLWSITLGKAAPEESEPAQEIRLLLWISRFICRPWRYCYFKHCGIQQVSCTQFR